MGRRAVIPERVTELMGEGGQHCWSIEDLQEALARRGFEPDPSSVFRAVNRLKDQRVVRKVELGDRRARYELAGEHHEHLVCDDCGAVESVPCALVEALAQEVWDFRGFVVSGHRLVLTGTCRACGVGPAPIVAGHRTGGVA
jgi:Fur family ferric uptake transcriptional regulator